MDFKQLPRLTSVAWQALAGALGGLVLGVAQATTTAQPPQPAQNEPWDFKATSSWYNSASTPEAVDLNLRAHRGAHTLWVGAYHDPNFDQGRAGWEYTVEGDDWQVVPSLQGATHGYASGSFSAQLGQKVYTILGWGRSNLQPYMNLNFDPNDAYTLGAGMRGKRSTLSLFMVKDDRLHTDQVVHHAVWRYSPQEGQRWTVDLSSKRGRPAENEASVSGLGLTVSYDYHDYFVRVTQEQKVNFTPDDQTRLALGMRF
ncbi:hypothetical protein [Leptothrix ochracea]|uniref:hypothetical protein n=1 Tax=Leptothrix ochracea TaxID=735331 RepID=UPI0034E2DDA8